MKILVTGAKGFIGRNLIAELSNRGYGSIYEFDRDSNVDLLSTYTRDCDFVFHLAGVNRSTVENDFVTGNYLLTEALVDSLKSNDNKCPVLVTSSIQAGDNTPYGKSKAAADDVLFNYQKETTAPVMVYRLSNLFGKWSKPNYNTVVATFCHNISRNLPIRIDDPDKLLNLCYIDDVIEEFLSALNGNPNFNGKYCEVETIHPIKLGELANHIYSFRESRQTLYLPHQGNPLIRKLYSTYLSFLSEDDFSYDLKMNIDSRGSFTEFIRTNDFGQVSVNITKPGISKGNHWHHSKNEKFLVIKGQALVRFREVGSEKTIEYHVSGDKLQVLDIPTGYSHSIANIGESDLITLMWANECFDSQKPDTYYLEV